MKRILKVFFLVLGMGIVSGFVFTTLSAKDAVQNNSVVGVFSSPADYPAFLARTDLDNPSATVNGILKYDDLSYFNEIYYPNNNTNFDSAGDAPGNSITIQPATTFLDQAAFEVRSLIDQYNVSSNSTAVFHDVPIKSQEDYLNGTACVPATVSMVLDYYNQVDPAFITQSIPYFIATLDEGDITEGYGISVNKIIDELRDIGYSNTFYLNGSKINLNTLVEYLKEGPVIVQTGLELGQNPRRIIGLGDTQHALVLKGISEDGRMVIVNDPWSGAELEFSLARFADMWNKGHNIALIIRA